jgi:hypothetical protein
MTQEMRQALVEQIEKAFADVPYPGDNNIANSYHGTVFCHDCAELARSFQGEDWRTVSLEKLIKYRDSIPSFKPEAFRFFLPAYMIATVLHFETVDVSSNNTLHELIPPTTREDQVNFGDLLTASVRNLSKQQRVAVRDFVKFYAFLNPWTRRFTHGYSKAVKFWERTSK